MAQEQRASVWREFRYRKGIINVTKFPSFSRVISVHLGSSTSHILIVINLRKVITMMKICSWFACCKYEYVCAYFVSCFPRIYYFNIQVIYHPPHSATVLAEHISLPSVQL